MTGRSPRSEAMRAGGRQRHSVRTDARPHASIEPSHESGVSSMKAAPHVQFERPRLERRPRNHRSPAAGRRHARRWTPPAAGRGRNSVGGKRQLTVGIDSGVLEGMGDKDRAFRPASMPCAAPICKHIRGKARERRHFASDRADSEMPSAYRKFEFEVW